MPINCTHEYFKCIGGNTGLQITFIQCVYCGKVLKINDSEKTNYSFAGRTKTKQY